jgi:protein-tyrosine phosphatase
MRTYLRIQWRRLFGLNATSVGPLLFVGGQFRPSQWPLLYALGVRAVLSLQAEREDRFDGPLPDRSLRLLVPDFHPPSLNQLVTGVSFIQAAHRAELPVLVHCHAGVGRAPMMAAAYYMSRYGMTYRDALSHLRAARPIIAPNFRQLARLREFEASLGRPEPSRR